MVKDALPKVLGCRIPMLQPGNALAGGPWTGLSWSLQWSRVTMRAEPFFPHVPSVKHDLVPETILRKTFVVFVLLYFYLFMAMIWLLDVMYLAVVWAAPVLGFDAEAVVQCQTCLAVFPKMEVLERSLPKAVGRAWTCMEDG